jgi:hypothetical protein
MSKRGNGMDMIDELSGWHEELLARDVATRMSPALIDFGFPAPPPHFNPLTPYLP